MKKENKYLLIMISVLVITTILDVGTALSSEIFKIAESNPVYILTGSIGPLLVMTVLFTALIIYWLYTCLSPKKIFLATIILLYLSLGHGFGAYSNVTATENYNQANEVEKNQMVEQYKAQTKEMKLTYYFSAVLIVMGLPLFISLFAFHITELLYNSRKNKREKIMEEIYQKSLQLTRK